MVTDASSGSLHPSVAYFNARIYTVDRSRPWAEAVIVSDTGVFSQVGSNDEILAQASREGLAAHDLGGRFVMPGLHDAHVHLLSAGLAELGAVDLGMDVTVGNVSQRLQAGSCSCAHLHAYDDWIVGNTFAIGDFDRDSLDRDFPNTPVMIQGGAGHSVFLNSAALERAGYDAVNEPDQKGAVYIRRADGSLTGELSELAMTKAFLSRPAPKLVDAKTAIQQAIRRLHRVGVTSCQEAATNTMILNALRELDSADKALCLDVAAHTVYAPEFLGIESEKSLHALIDRASEFSTRHVQTNFIKMMLDGVPLPPYLTHCGLDEGGRIDESKIFMDDLTSAVAKYDARGMTIKVHCTGQGSTRLALNAIDAARKENPGGPRHEIAHCCGVNNEDFARFSSLNVTAEMSPAVFFTHPLTAASNGLMNWDFSAFIAKGANITIGSDWSTPSDPSLFPAVAGLVDKVGHATAEDDSGLGETTSARSRGARNICRMLTQGGAEAVGLQDRSGSIEKGKRAHFIMLDRDITVEGFEGVKVLRTWFEGGVVWDAETVE